jgi:hypothetical protein
MLLQIADLGATCCCCELSDREKASLINSSPTIHQKVCMNQAYEAVLGKMHNNCIFIDPVSFYLFTMYQEFVASSLQIELFSDTPVLCILL